MNNGILRALRTPAFLLLYWLRTPVRATCKVFMIACMVGLAAGSLGIKPFAQWHTQIGLLLVSFALFVVRWGYDALLIKLAPARSIIGDRYS